MVPGPVLCRVGNKGLSRGVIQARVRRMVRCTERQVHMEGKHKLCGPAGTGARFRPILPGRQTGAGSK